MKPIILKKVFHLIMGSAFKVTSIVIAKSVIKNIKYLFDTETVLNPAFTYDEHHC